MFGITDEYFDASFDLDHKQTIDLYKSQLLVKFEMMRAKLLSQGVSHRLLYNIAFGSINHDMLRHYGELSPGKLHKNHSTDLNTLTKSHSSPEWPFQLTYGASAGRFWLSYIVQCIVHSHPHGNSIKDNDVL